MSPIFFPRHTGPDPRPHVPEKKPAPLAQVTTGAGFFRQNRPTKRPNARAANTNTGVRPPASSFPDYRNFFERDFVSCQEISVGLGQRLRLTSGPSPVASSVAAETAKPGVSPQ